MNEQATLTWIELPGDSRVNFTQGMKYLVTNDSNPKSKVVGCVEDNASNQEAIESARCFSVIWGNVVYGDELVCLPADKYRYKFREYFIPAAQ